MSNWKTIVTKDFTYHIKENEGMAGIEFEVYEVVGWEMKGARLYEKKGAEVLPTIEHTTVIEEAATFIRGWIKWDGCSHFWFGDENQYLHLCGLDRIARLKDVLDVLIAEAKVTGVEER